MICMQICGPVCPLSAESIFRHAGGVDSVKALKSIQRSRFKFYVNSVQAWFPFKALNDLTPLLIDRSFQRCFRSIFEVDSCQHIWNGWPLHVC